MLVFEISSKKLMCAYIHRMPIIIGCFFIDVNNQELTGDLSPLTHKRLSFCHFKLPGGVLLAQIQPLLYPTACIVGAAKLMYSIVSGSMGANIQWVLILIL